MQPPARPPLPTSQESLKDQRARANQVITPKGCEKECSLGNARAE